MPSPRGWTQLLLIAAITLGGCKSGAAVPDGDIAASLTLPTTTDTTFDPAALRGKPTLVLFASPTCGHCNTELPVAQRAAALASANLVAVYVVGAKQHAASVTRYAKFTAPVLVDDGTLRKRFEITAVPYLLVLGPDGHARHAFRGEQDETTLVAALTSAR
jgi:thiol-disulfide isomerase/thioredoxin